MNGTLVQYDDLCQALETYEAHPNAVSYVVLRQVAIRCGSDLSEPIIAFAKRRVATYRATVTGAVSHLQSVIEEICP